MPLSPPQIERVKRTAPVLKQHGEAITIQFYSNLLREVPALQETFNQTHQATHRQASALAGALYAYASHIDDLGALTPAVQKICHRHASLYVQPEQYAVVGRYLLQAMGQVLGSALTQDDLDSWAAAYQQLADLMISQEADLYGGTQGWTGWKEFTVVNKVHESDEITSFYFEPLDKEPLPLYRPGQYVSVRVQVPQLGYSQMRQYSLSGAPDTQRYRISVKREQAPRLENTAHLDPGYVSSVLHERTEAGHVVHLSHPFGEFYWNPQQDSGKPVVLMSAGVGITPLIAILDTMLQQKEQQQIVFLHSARTSAARAFRGHLQDAAATHANIRYKSFLTAPGANEVKDQDFEEKGRLAIDTLDREIDLLLDDGAHRAALYFICGPEQFMLENSAALKRLGVPTSRIRLELFGTGASVGL